MVEPAVLVCEPDSDSMAEKRSCMNFPSACRLWPGEPAAAVDEVELLEAAWAVDETLSAPVAADPFAWVGKDSPTWLNACMMLWSRESLPPEVDWALDVWLPAVPLPPDCWLIVER